MYLCCQRKQEYGSAFKLFCSYARLAVVSVGQFLAIHSENPQPRLVREAVSILREGGVIVYPTDSAYALGCQIGNKQPLDRIRSIRSLEPNHNFTLACRDLSELGTFSRVNNAAYRMIRRATPGPYTFILQAAKIVPRRLVHPKKKTVGIRLPSNPIAQSLLYGLDEPMISSTLKLFGREHPLTDPHQIRELLGSELDLVIDGGLGGTGQTSIVDCSRFPPIVIRRGLGDISDFEFS